MLRLKGDKLFGICNTVLLLVITFIFAYPLYFTIIASVSEPVNVVAGDVVLYPKGFTLDAYTAVFKNETIWVGYRNTIMYTIGGTLFGLLLAIPAAYVLSKRTLKLRGLLSTYFVFTMYFGGGLIPTYLVVRDLNLLNKPYTLIVLGAMSVYNMVVARVYFDTSIPGELYEAAEIDGCGRVRQFFVIAIPLAKPVIAVVALNLAVAKWNDFFTALVYVNNADYYPLQLVLRNILLQNQTDVSMLDASSMDTEQLLYLTRQAYMAEAMKYSLIFIASLPMLIIYPFIQKYFTKGMMVGSVKG